MTTADTETHIGTVIETLAKLKGVRKDDVAKAIGMPRSTWYTRFADEDWTAREVSRLATYFGVPEGVFFREPAELLAALRESHAGVVIPRYEGENLVVTAPLEAA